MIDHYNPFSFLMSFFFFSHIDILYIQPTFFILFSLILFYLFVFVAFIHSFILVVNL